MKIERAELRRSHVPLKAPFETSFGRFMFRDCILVGVSGGGETGYAESVAMPSSTRRGLNGTGLRVLAG